MENIILIESDSDHSIIILDNDECVEAKCSSSEKFSLKRDLSSDFSQKIALNTKKLKIPEDNLIERKKNNMGLDGAQTSQISIKYTDFVSNDVRLDSRLYFNRVDENEQFDVKLYIWCVIEVILDLASSKSIVYGVEHYYHQLAKKKKFKENDLILKKMKEEYEIVFIAKDTKELNSEDFILAKKNYEMQIKSQEFICKFLLTDLKNFVKFIQDTYENKIILP